MEILVFLRDIPDWFQQRHSKLAIAIIALLSATAGTLLAATIVLLAAAATLTVSLIIIVNWDIDEYNKVVEIANNHWEWRKSCEQELAQEKADRRAVTASNLACNQTLSNFVRLAVEDSGLEWEDCEVPQMSQPDPLPLPDGSPIVIPLEDLQGSGLELSLPD